MWHFATKIRFKRRWTWLLLALVTVLVASCGPVTVTNPDGSTSNIPYESWLATAESEDNLTAVQQRIGTFTPTPSSTPTMTPTTTATMTPIPTETPIPTATPFTGYWVVDNKAGEVIHEAEFQPECGGEWGYPGMDVWRVQYGQLVEKVCSTPWNKPQNMAIKAVLYVGLGFLVFVGALIGASELRKYKLARARKAASQGSQRQLTAPVDNQPVSSDEIANFIRLVRQVDGPLATRLYEFRRANRQLLLKRSVRTVVVFSEVVEELDFLLFEQIQSALQKQAAQIQKRS